MTGLGVMGGSLFGGIGYLLQGFGLIMKPGIRPYVLIPLTINVLLFSTMIYFAWLQVNNWIAMLIGWLPGWMAFVDWLLWLIFTLVIAVVLIFTFTLMANFIAAPFNGLLSEAVERHLRGEPVADNGRSLLMEIPHALARELRKMLYYLPRLLLVFILGLIPPVTLVAPLLWFLLAAWMLAIQYMDFPMDNHGIGFADMRNRLRAQRLTHLGFGGAALGVMMIPLVNFLIMPAAVAGATALWVEQYKD